MDDVLEKLIKQIESLSLDIVMLDAQDIPGLGNALTYIESMEALSKELKEESITSLIKAMKGYVEKVILGEKTELSPVEKSLTKLQEICRDIINGRQPQKNISEMLSGLGYDTEIEQTESHVDEEIEIDIEDDEESNETGEGQKREDKKETLATIDEDDREIIADFVAESLENLDKIEIKLVDLEQDPSDLDTINDIFRPFHTVKGVSGFLNFNKINELSHTAENLLDKVRNGQIHIVGEIVDIVLETVDVLKRMIENIQTSLNSGQPSEGDMDTSQIISKIEYILSQAELRENKYLGEILVEKGTISQDDLFNALEVQKTVQEKKIGEILVEQNKSEPKDVLDALREQKKSAKQFVDFKTKVDTGKLDNIVDMVGELAIAQSMLRQHDNIKASTNRELDQIINQLNLIISGLQKTAMSLRMVPIKNTFQKMLRLVRDLSKKANKEVQLLMSGEDTEIDRNMVEEIYEPMVHMVRNSIDHGLEPLEERSRAKKPSHGTIYLRAYHKGGDFVIEIADDGRGLNRDKILKKAASKGLIKENEKLSDGEINNLIFKPGFSTAEKITDISGRGVGMDVVKNIIVDKLRGRVEAQSNDGKGTTFFIRLPLTLAIVDGMIVKIGEEKYILPTLSIQESFRPKKSDCHTVKGKGEVIMFRNNLVPLIRLNRLFVRNGGQHALDTQPWEKLVVVVENQGRTRCLLVDELLGQEEVVIKSLGETLKDLKGIAGGAILGDGRVGLILDIAGIFDIASEGQ
jgi:two-component system, chemotaxis family, sensor kinase CheA